MKKGYAVVLLALVLLVSVHALKLNGYVTDSANVLSPAEEELLAQQIGNLERNTSVQIAIVTVPDTGGDDKSSYAIALGEENGVGKKGEDNGVVILWVEGEQHGGFIATGRGIESVLTDSEVSSIGRSSRPLFDQKQYYQGFKTILDGIEQQVKTEYVSTTTFNSGMQPIGLPDIFGSGGISTFMIFIAIGFFIMITISFFRAFTSGDDGNYSSADEKEYSSTHYRRKKGSKGKRDDDDHVAGYVAAAYIGSQLGKGRGGGGSSGGDSGGSSGGFSGGGFGGFGGGSFGGGGGGF